MSASDQTSCAYVPPSATLGAGILASVGLHGFVIVLTFVSGLVLAGDESSDDGIVDEDDVIAAEIIQLGEELPEEELPNRVVPQMPTAPSDEEVVSANPDAEKIEKKEKKPKESKADLLKHLADRTDLFAENTEELPLEGDPNGEKGGSQNAQGDRYRGKLKGFLKRGWTVPVTISESEQQKLKATASVSFNEAMQVVSFRIMSPSGNVDFDQSIMDHLGRLKSEGVAAPEPPLEDAPKFKNASMSLRISGKHGKRK